MGGVSKLDPVMCGWVGTIMIGKLMPAWYKNGYVIINKYNSYSCTYYRTNIPSHFLLVILCVHM